MNTPIYRTIILCWFFLFGTLYIQAQDSLVIQNLESALDSLFQQELQEQRIPGAALIIVKDGNVLLKKGYGFSSLGEEINYVNPDSTIFRIGSVTKSFTALALLQQIDQNRIRLQDDVNQYLNSLKIPKQFNQPITPFHLLTHSAGLDELRGRRVFNQAEQIGLASFLGTRLQQIRTPGQVTAYSTYGIALAGLLVEDLTKVSLESYMKTNIWAPLGMQMTSITLPEEHGPYTALGYETYNNINVPQPWEWYHTFPASSINSTVTDMGKYMQMLLNGGQLNNKHILSEDLTKKMLTQQLAIHPQIDGFTFGLYERTWNGIPSINHGGEMLGYSSFMTLLPEENIGIFVVHHHEGTNLRYLAIQTIIDALVPQNTEEAMAKKIKLAIEKFTGSYRWLSNCQTCTGSSSQQTWQLTAHKDGTLSGFNRTFYPIGPLLFKSTDGQRTMGFKTNKEGNIQYMSLGNINVFEKVK